MQDTSFAADDLQARLASIIELSDDAIIAKDLTGTIQSWNRGAEQIFGYARDEVVGKHISILIPPDLLGEEASIIEKIRKGERIAHYETVRRHKDGRRIDISLSVSAVKDAAGRVIGASKIARDITYRKAARRAVAEMNSLLEQRIQDRTRHLQQALADLDSFNAAVSHDLRTPLRAITGFIEIVLEESNLDPEQRRRLNMAFQASHEMKRTIDALLRLSRLQTQEIRREEVDVTRIAQRILTRLQNQRPERLVDAHVEEGVTALADAAMTEVVLENLLLNAWKFSAAKDVRCIRVRRGGAANGFSVADNGIGFKDAEASTLFRPFQRLRPAEFEGMGMGLATVQRIVAAHGGWARATGRPGLGATISVDFGGRGPVPGRWTEEPENPRAAVPATTRTPTVAPSVVFAKDL